MSGENTSQAKLDRRVYRVWLEILFREALSKNRAWRDSIQAGTEQDDIRLFARYVERVVPVVAIESSIPYAEHLIIELVSEHAHFKTPVFLPSLLSGAWLDNRNRPLEARRPLVLSFQEPNGLDESMVVVHDIETTDNPVLIGCDHLSQVPVEFHRLIDLRLTLSPASTGQFSSIFSILFGSSLPDEVGEDARWRDYVTPTDVQPALRLSYSPEEAACYIRERVNTRLSRLEVADAPSLDDLHGLGEAREIALDLVNDIQLAGEGRIDWDEVDRGLLLVGPPGTGKTTLARAIARDCGVKFISVSTTQWQSMDGLGSHLEAIRSTFAEARRFSPAILFIDEIDSIGSREEVSGASLTYQTTVTNYLLEQLDGFSERGEIVVIGATNFEDMVDPALRRAGRLDQVVHVSYPTIRALAKIYAGHLEAYANRLATNIDYEALAQLSFGLTGADVEFFVRGAARRARKRRDKIHQDDLVAEVMRRPRDASQALAYDAATIYRLAVHEAGHAAIRLLGKFGGEEISYVSIAPRSDGRVGYIAAFDDKRVSMTREDFLHELRILLAGRAAEEVIFGADNVSDLSGNYEADSDLAQATRLAQYLQCNTGLDEIHGLLWRGAGILHADSGDLDDQADTTLREAYASTVEILSGNKGKIEVIARYLEQQQEIDGIKLQALFERPDVQSHA